MALSRRMVLLSAAVVLGAVLLVWFAWQAAAIRQESEFHELHYQVSISTEATLGRVTLLLPVPVVHNTSSLGEAIGRGEGYGIPPGWNVSLEVVNGTPFLEIEAGQILPEYHSYPIPLEESQTPVQTPSPAATAYSAETPVLMPLQFGISQRVERTIDTRNPVGQEPILSPPELVRSTPCPDIPHTGACYRYPAAVFARYSQTGAGNVTISISAGGTNQWWLGGWTGNSYTDSLMVTLENGEQGWVVSEGLLAVGEGRYEKG